MASCICLFESLGDNQLSCVINHELHTALRHLRELTHELLLNSFMNWLLTILCIKASVTFFGLMHS